MRLENSNSIAILKFSEDGDYPRLTRVAMAQLAEWLGRIEGAAAFRGVVIAAGAKSFATGAEVEEISPLEGMAALDFARRGQALFNRIACFPIPVVAAIRGYCMGGGLDLALACRERVASYDASFAHPGASLGLMTGWGGTQRLPRRLGKSAALQMLLTGERIPATQALTLGLVDELASSQDLIEAAAHRAMRAGSGESRAADFAEPDFEFPSQTGNHPRF